MNEKKYQNKQHKYDSYAIEHGLKRLKMYHKDHKQWNNFKLYIECHKRMEEAKEFLKGKVDYFNILTNRDELEDVIRKAKGYDRAEFPNYYHYDMIKLADDFSSFVNEYKKQLTPLTITTKGIVEIFNITKDYYTPSDLLKQFSFMSADLGTTVYAVINGKEYSTAGFDNCLYIFNNWEELNT